MTNSDYDPLAVAFYDIAHEGAQVRAVASAVSAGILDSCVGAKPRSVVVLAREELLVQCAQLACALRSPLLVPIVIDSQLPQYVGALDIVIALSEHGDDPQLEEALVIASRRGATCVFAGLSDSPLATELESHAGVIPSLPGVEGPSPARATAVVLAVLDLLSHSPVEVAQREESWAQEIEQELELLAPMRADGSNVARQLAGITGNVIHSAHNSVGLRIAQLAATLWTMNAKVSAMLSGDELAGVTSKMAAPVHDIFYDPLIDGPEELLSLTVVIWNADAGITAPYIQEKPSVDPDVSALRLLTRAFAATAFFGGNED